MNSFSDFDSTSSASGACPMTMCAKFGLAGDRGRATLNSGQVKRTMAAAVAARERHDFEDRLFGAGWLLDLGAELGQVRSIDHEVLLAPRI